MNVAADDALNVFAEGVARDGFLKSADEADGILDAAFYE